MADKTQQCDSPQSEPSDSASRKPLPVPDMGKQSNERSNKKERFRTGRSKTLGPGQHPTSQELKGKKVADTAHGKAMDKEKDAAKAGEKASKQEEKTHNAAIKMMQERKKMIRERRKMIRERGQNAEKESKRPRDTQSSSTSGSMARGNQNQDQSDQNKPNRKTPELTDEQKREIEKISKRLNKKLGKSRKGSDSDLSEDVLDQLVGSSMSEVTDEFAKGGIAEALKKAHKEGISAKNIQRITKGRAFKAGLSEEDQEASAQFTTKLLAKERKEWFAKHGVEIAKSVGSSVGSAIKDVGTKVKDFAFGLLEDSPIAMGVANMVSSQISNAKEFIKQRVEAKKEEKIKRLEKEKELAALSSEGDKTRKEQRETTEEVKKVGDAVAEGNAVLSRWEAMAKMKTEAMGGTYKPNTPAAPAATVSANDVMGDKKPSTGAASDTKKAAEETKKKRFWQRKDRKEKKQRLGFFKSMKNAISTGMIAAAPLLSKLLMGALIGGLAFFVFDFFAGGKLSDKLFGPIKEEFMKHFDRFKTWFADNAWEPFKQWWVDEGFSLMGDAFKKVLSLFWEYRREETAKGEVRLKRNELEDMDMSDPETISNIKTWLLGIGGDFERDLFETREEIFEKQGEIATTILQHSNFLSENPELMTTFNELEKIRKDLENRQSRERENPDYLLEVDQYMQRRFEFAAQAMSSSDESLQLWGNQMNILNTMYKGFLDDEVIEALRIELEGPEKEFRNADIEKLVTKRTRSILTATGIGLGAVGGGKPGAIVGGILGFGASDPIARLLTPIEQRGSRMTKEKELDRLSKEASAANTIPEVETSPTILDGFRRSQDLDLPTYGVRANWMSGSSTPVSSTTYSLDQFKNEVDLSKLSPDKQAIVKSILDLENATDTEKLHMIFKAMIESSGIISKSAPNSSAAGPFQFLDGTWRQVIKDARTSGVISKDEHERLKADTTGSIRTSRDSTDLALNTRLAHFYYKQNEQTLRNNFPGVDIDSAMHYLAWQQGATGASNIIRGARENRMLTNTAMARNMYNNPAYFGLNKMLPNVNFGLSVNKNMKPEEKEEMRERIKAEIQKILDANISMKQLYSNFRDYHKNRLDRHDDTVFNNLRQGLSTQGIQDFDGRIYVGEGLQSSVSMGDALPVEITRNSQQELASALMQSTYTRHDQQMANRQDGGGHVSVVNAQGGPTQNIVSSNNMNLMGQGTQHPRRLHIGQPMGQKWA